MFVWLRQHDDAVRMRTLAEEQSKQADSLAVLLDARNKIMLRQDSLIKAQTAAIREQEIRLVQAGIAAQNQTNTAVNTLRSQLSESLKPLLDSVTRGYEKQLAIKDQQIESERKINLLLQTQVSQRDSTLEAIRRLNDALSAQLAVINKQTHKGIIAQAKAVLPWIAAGYIAAKASN